MNDDDEFRQKIKEYCSACEAYTYYDRIFVHERIAEDEVPEEYTLAACRNCGEPALFYREELQIQQEILEVEEPDYHLLWPSTPRLLSCQLPEAVARPYSEACHAELMKLPMSSAVMIGRALEATCKDFDPASISISDGLRRMTEAGALSDELFEWADELRVIRNEAAHASHVHIEQSEVSEALDFLQTILKVLYEYRPKFKRFKASRGAD